MAFWQSERAKELYNVFLGQVGSNLLVAADENIVFFSIPCRRERLNDLRVDEWSEHPSPEAKVEKPIVVLDGCVFENLHVSRGIGNAVLKYSCGKFADVMSCG
jgi:hypothetical protein